ASSPWWRRGSRSWRRATGWPAAGVSPGPGRAGPERGGPERGGPRAGGAKAGGPQAGGPGGGGGALFSPPPPAAPPRGAPRAPAQQLLSGPLTAQLALVDPQLEQEVPGPPDHRARPHAEHPHDLVAVELRPQPGQFLLLAELGDALFQAVVGAGQPGRLGAVP